MRRIMLCMLAAALTVGMTSMLAAAEGKKPQRPKAPAQAKAPQFNAKVLFTRLDKDKDGKLNFDEFCVGLRHLRQMWVVKAPQAQMTQVRAFAGKVMTQGPWGKGQPGVKVKVAVKKAPCGPQGCPMMAKGPQKGQPGKQFAKGPQKGRGQFAWGQFQGKGHGPQFANGPQKGHGKYAWGHFQGKGHGPQFAKGPQFCKCPWCHKPPMARMGMKPGMGPWGMKPGMGPWGMKPGMGPQWGMMRGPMPGMKPGMGPGPKHAFGAKPIARKAPAAKKPAQKPDVKRPAAPKQPQKPEAKANLERKVAELERRLTAVERQQAAILTAIQEQQATMMAALRKTNELVTAKLASMGRDTERARPQWDKAKAEQKSRETARAGQKAKQRPQPQRGERN